MGTLVDCLGVGGVGHLRLGSLDLVSAWVAGGKASGFGGSIVLIACVCSISHGSHGWLLASPSYAALSELYPGLRYLRDNHA